MNSAIKIILKSILLCSIIIFFTQCSSSRPHQIVSMRIDDEDSLAINNPGKTIAGNAIGDSTNHAGEEMPQFPGGDKALFLSIGKEIQYPLFAKNQGVEGKVHVTFVVTKEGNVTDIHVTDGIGYGCDSEAIRVVKLLPKWISGKKNGVPVNVRITIPIVFQLQ